MKPKVRVKYSAGVVSSYESVLERGTLVRGRLITEKVSGSWSFVRVVMPSGKVYPLWACALEEDLFSAHVRWYEALTKLLTRKQFSMLTSMSEAVYGEQT